MCKNGCVLCDKFDRVPQKCCGGRRTPANATRATLPSCTRFVAEQRSNSTKSGIQRQAAGLVQQPARSCTEMCLSCSSLCRSNSQNQKKRAENFRSPPHAVMPNCLNKMILARAVRKAYPPPEQINWTLRIMHKKKEGAVLCAAAVKPFGCASAQSLAHCAGCASAQSLAHCVRIKHRAEERKIHALRRRELKTCTTANYFCIML